MPFHKPKVVYFAVIMTAEGFPSMTVSTRKYSEWAADACARNIYLGQQAAKDGYVVSVVPAPEAPIRFANEGTHYVYTIVD